MKGLKQNRIQSVVLNFKYETKVAAVRSNVLIESIFNSKVLPELDKVISMKIPEGALLELAKLEIDVGTINENELANNLADRIGIALAEALHDTTRIIVDSKIGGSSTNDSNFDNFQLDALECYCIKGYFPIWVDPLHSLGDLMKMALHENKGHLIQLLFKLCKNEIATKRIAYGLPARVFDELLLALNPLKEEWITDLMKTLLRQKNERRLTILTNKETMSIDEENQFQHLNTEIKVRNAGLILFWPFLTRFFEHLSLLKNGVFVDEKCRIQAVYLLQYLVYNTIDAPEHQLVINKALVGMLPHELVLPIPPLSKDAKNLAESLINGLISNWEKVKDSTPEAIQETFLQRDGILSIEKDKMILTVEKRGVDVLLTSISWNITLVKLPWMKLPLYVEWV